MYYNPYKTYKDNQDNYGFGNYGYNGGYQQNRYPGSGYGNMNQDMFSNKPMKIPVQIPKIDHDGMEEWDKKKIKALYPEVCKRIQYYIDEACDKMDCSSSYMYDEYPEREVIEMTIDKIYKKVENDDRIMNEFGSKMSKYDTEEELDATGRYDHRPYRWLRYLIQILLLNEIFGRRRRRNKRKRRRPLYYNPTPYYYKYPNFFE